MAGAGNRGFGMPEQPSTGTGTGTGTSRTGTHQGTGSHQGTSGQQHAASGGVAETVKQTAQDLASSVASRAGDAWESVSSQAGDVWEGARQGVSQAASTVADSAQDAFVNVRTFMGRYPFATLCAGIGIGFLFSRLLEGNNFSSSGWNNMRSYPNNITP